MSRAIPVSDEMYKTTAALAHAQRTTPEALTETLLSERLAERQAISRQNEEWAAGLDETLARAERGENARYNSTEAFFAALDYASSSADATR